MVPLRGWSPCGERLNGHAPFGHWNTTTFLVALRHNRIDAPWVIDSPINGGRFQVDVAHVLAPTLAPGNIVVMDNLGSHKGQAARQAIRRPAPSCSSWPNTHPTSTRSSSSSPGSSITLEPHFLRG